MDPRAARAGGSGAPRRGLPAESGRLAKGDVYVGKGNAKVPPSKWGNRFSVQRYGRKGAIMNFAECPPSRT